MACTRNLAAWNLRPKDFLETREKDVISGRWLYLLVVIMAEQGVRIFIEMLLENDEPNKLRLTTVLSLCSTVQSSDLRAQVRSLSTILGHESNQCGCIDEAKNLFDRMEYKILIMWNAMIAGHKQWILRRIIFQHNTQHVFDVEYSPCQVS